MWCSSEHHARRRRGGEGDEANLVREHDKRNRQMPFPARREYRQELTQRQKTPPRTDFLASPGLRAMAQRLEESSGGPPTALPRRG
jgi:hypothetical protein